MDLYGAWDPSTASSSGTNTPMTEAAADGATRAGGNQTGQSNDASASTSGSSGHAGRSAASPTLEQEVEQMGALVSGMGKNLGSYWSSFRKQSVTAIKQSQAYASTAAKDFTPYLDKAKAELDKLGEQARASAAAGQAASVSELGVNVDNPAVAIKAPREDKGKGVDRSGQNDVSSPSGSVTTLKPEGGEDEQQQPAMTAAAFFTRLQGQLSSNPNYKQFQSSLQTMQHDLKNKVVDFNKIDLHEAKDAYEKAMNSGEKYWKVASKELTELFGDAVRIVPPEGFATAGESTRATGAAGKMADKRRKEAAVAAAGRKETMLHRVRSDPAVLLVDPAQPLSESASSEGAEKRETHSDAREAFATFLASVEAQGGIDGQTWKDKIQSELNDETSGQVLKQTHDSIVPDKLPSEAFWTRYFFRVQQIEEDEARRREILEGAAQQEDDDFSWDMEDESASSAAPDDEEPEVKTAVPKDVKCEDVTSTPKIGTSTTQSASSPGGSDNVGDSWIAPSEGPLSPQQTDKAAPTSGDPRPAATKTASSPRNSSEEGTASSYDVVSAGEANSPTMEKAAPKKSQADDGDSDSDWE